MSMIYQRNLFAESVHDLNETAMPSDEFVNKSPRRSSFRHENISTEKNVSSQSGLIQADNIDLEIQQSLHAPNGTTRLKLMI